MVNTGGGGFQSYLIRSRIRFIGNLVGIIGKRINRDLDTQTETYFQGFIDIFHDSWREMS